MPRKHRVAPPEQKLVEGNTPMNRSPNGRSYPMTEAMIEGRKRGGFKKGKSGNPRGRPPLPEEIKEKIAYMTPDAVDKVYELMNTSDNAMVQLKAAELLIGTQISKAASKVEVDVEVTHTSDFLMQLARARNIVIEHEENRLIDVTPNDEK
jgi:hypothetical protein